MPPLLRRECALVLVSALWLLLVPLIHHEPAAFGVTGCIVLGNTVYSLRCLARTRRFPLLLSCVQIALFGALSFQLDSAFGAGHFHFDRAPQLVDWIEFTLAHVVRAADVLDALEEYGICIQMITHRSAAAGLILVAMHLTVDAFLLDLVVRWLKRRQPEEYETRLQRGRREFAWLLVALTLFFCFGILFQFRPGDWLLWPLDQVIRLIDVGDVMNVFGWRLHGVAVNGWTSTVALAFRFTAGVWLARFLILGRLTVLRALGLSVDELILLLDDHDASLRLHACAGLEQIGPEAHGAVPTLIEALHDIDDGVRLAAMRALGAIGAAADDAVPRLIDALWHEQAEVRATALRALGQIGPAAHAAVHSLVYLLKVTDGPLRAVMLQVLEQIAPDARAAAPLEPETPQDPPEAAPPSKRQAAWQTCVAAAQARDINYSTVRAQLNTLLDAGFFADERDAAVLQETLGGDIGMLALPLMELLAEGKLLRRRNTLGKWSYRANPHIPHSPLSW